jgi:RNase P subunit RPR2
MAKLSDNLSEYGDHVKVKILRILCSECGQPIPDESLDRLADEEKLSLHCKACGNLIVIILSDVDAFCDNLIA